MKITFISILLLCLSLFSFSQTLTGIINQPNTTYFDIQKQIYQNNSKFLKSLTDKELKHYHRWQWFWSSRVDSDGHFDFYGRQISKYFGNLQKDNNETLPISWQCCGPFGNTIQGNKDQIGRVTSLWVHPTNHNIVWAGAATGGLWKTENALSSNNPTWICKTAPLPGGIYDIVVHPTNTQTMYIILGMFANGIMRTSNGYSFGVYKSTDGGEHWDVALSTATSNCEFFRSIIIHPTNPSILYVISEWNIYKSIDAGITWTILKRAAANQQFIDIEFHPTNFNIIYVSGNNILCRTIDAGNTWTDITSNIPNLPTNTKIAIAVNRTTPDYLYVHMVNYDFCSKVLKSINWGNQWDDFAYLNYDRGGTNWSLEIKVSPSNQYLYIGGHYLHKYLPSGNLVSTFNGKIHDDVQVIVFPNKNNDNIVFVGTDGGVERSLDGGNTWTCINGNLAINQCYSVAITEQNANIVLTGCHDNHSFRRNADGTWTNFGDGDGGNCIIDYSNMNNIYWMENREVNCTNQQIITLPEYNSPMAQHPTKPYMIYYGDWVLRRNQYANSNPVGITWLGTNGSVGITTAIAISPSKPNYSYFAFKNPSTKHTSIWKDTNDFNNSSPIRISDNLDAFLLLSAKVMDIEIHPTDHKKIWVAFGNFVAENKVYTSSNAGETWINYSEGLPNFPINCVAYDKNYDCLYAGTDVGVFYRNKRMMQWQEYQGNLPKTIISDLKINNTSRELIAATYGRGIWKTTLQCTYPTPSNPNINSTPNQICEWTGGILLKILNVEPNTSYFWFDSNNNQLNSQSVAQIRVFASGEIGDLVSFSAKALNICNESTVSNWKSRIVSCPADFVLYPNPSNDFLNIEFETEIDSIEYEIRLMIF